MRIGPLSARRLVPMVLAVACVAAVVDGAETGAKGGSLVIPAWSLMTNHCRKVGGRKTSASPNWSTWTCTLQKTATFSRCESFRIEEENLQEADNLNVDPK